MNLESHPAMHYVVVFLFYNLGLLINVLGQAFATMLSKMNGIHSVKTYFALRWIPIAMRWFVCTCMFLIIWENPSILNLEKYMPTFGAHVGIAGALGFLSDTVWDRVLGIIAPGIHKSLPPIPNADPNAPNN